MACWGLVWAEGAYALLHPGLNTALLDFEVIVIPLGPRQPTSKAQVCLNAGVMRSLLLCWAFWSFGGRLARAKDVVFR